jgi:hypothetical protein
MKHLFVLIFVLIICCGQCQNLEFGIKLGTTHYLGDLTETMIKLQQTKFGAGLLFRYYAWSRVNFKANIFYGSIGGADSLKPGYYDPVHNTVKTIWAKYRNLSFRSYILDASLELELNLKPYISGHRKYNWTPYLLGGIAVFNFNPQAKYNGKWYDLQPLGTEGQETSSPNAQKKYKLTQIAIPYGIGIKYSFRQPITAGKINLVLWNIGIELSSRKTFTDHLDDVGGYYPDYEILKAARGTDGSIAVALSDRQAEALAPLRRSDESEPKREPGTTRGNPKKMDQYMFFGLTLTKTFRLTNIRLL